MPINQIKYGALISYLTLFLNVIIGLLYTPWLIESIGKADYGLYTLAMSIINLLAFDFGLGRATTKFVSQYNAEGRQDKVDNLLGLIYKLYIYADVCILVLLGVVYLLLPQIYTGLTSSEIEKLSIIYIIASIYCLIHFPFIPQVGILNSYEKFYEMKMIDLFHRLIVVVTMSICLLLGWGLYALVIVNSISGIISIALRQMVIHRKLPIKINYKYWSRSEIKEIFTFTFWVTIIALAQRCIFNIAPTILGRYADAQAIAVLGVAITLESYVYLFAGALNGLFLPRISKLVANNNQNTILDLMVKVGRIQIIIIGFIIIWIVGIGEQFIFNWLDESYVLVYPCLLLIVIPSFFQLPQEIGLSYIVVANKVKLQAYLFIGMAILNLLLVFPLTKLYGSIGLCLSIFISYMFRTIGLDYLFYKELKLNIFIFFRESFMKLASPIIISVLLILVIEKMMSGILAGWDGIIVRTILYGAIYLGCMLLMGINDYERKTFIMPIKTVLKKIRRK